MLDTTAAGRAGAFLGRFEAALSAGDVEAAVGLFAEDCYWRDLVAFTWNFKTLEGREQVRDMLKACLARVKPSNWHVAANEPVTEAGGVIEIWFGFETEVARGYGLMRLKDGLIWTLLTTMVELKGHEEKAGFTRPLGAKHGVNVGAKSWKEEREEEASTLGFTKQPYTVIIGGGQGGIALGARLRQLGVPTIIVERNARPGDSWRNRYKSLCLHALGRQGQGMDRRRRARRQGDRAEAQAARLRHGHVGQGQRADLQGHGPLQGRAAPLLQASRA